MLTFRTYRLKDFRYSQPLQINRFIPLNNGIRLSGWLILSFLKSNRKRNKLNFHANSTKHIIRFTSTNFIAGSLIISDGQGRSIINEPFNGYYILIDMHQLTPGYYYYKIISNTSETIKAGKLILVK